MKNKEVEEKLRCENICPMEFTMDVIAGKWKLVILWHIYDKEIIRYGELKKCVGKITHKMLSNKLKELVSDDIIHKKIYHQIPPKVEYSLTEEGQTLIPVMNMLVKWGAENKNYLEKYKV